MDDKEAIPQQTPEQKKELREIATRCDHVSDRLAGHGIVFGVNYRSNAIQPDGSVVDGLGISRSLSAELALMEMMADWYDAKKKAIESGEMGRFMSEVLELQGGPSN
tara:strand:+ start:4358 stop:4678 length:321 start_codon:yes stop_codon:yes gene_type:complete